MKLLVVNYHYFREETYTNGIFPTASKKLMADIDLIYKNNFKFIGQPELIQLLKNNNNYPHQNYCLITWDDGLKEQMLAFDILNKLGIPSMYFVPTKTLSDKIVLDVHKLQLIRTQIDDNQLFDNIQKTYSVSFSDKEIIAMENQYRYDDTLARKIKFFINFKINSIEREQLLSYLFINTFGDENKFSNSFYMNTDDFCKLSAHHALGSHGHSHLPLATLPSSEAVFEIKHSIEILQNITSKTVESFSYPYGGITAVNELVTDYFKTTDIVLGFTMFRGINDFSTEVNPLLLKRIDNNDLKSYLN